MAYAFTCDEEINAFEHEERAVDLTGYVHAVDGIKPLRTSQGHVLKFVLNNDSKTRMRVLIWGTSMAKLWEPRVQMFAVLQIVGGTVKLGNPRYRDPDVHQMEFHCQPTTDIQVLGVYSPQRSVVVNNIYRPVDFVNAMFEEGEIEIDCYLRTQLRVVQTNRATSGQGQVTDGVYRLAINIASYVADERLTVGTPITIYGEMSREPAFFTIKNMTGIVIRQNDARISREEAVAGFHPLRSANRRRLNNDVNALINVPQAVPAIVGNGAPVIAPIVEPAVIQNVAPVVVPVVEAAVIQNVAPVVVPVVEAAVVQNVAPIVETVIVQNVAPVVEAAVVQNVAPVVEAAVVQNVEAAVVQNVAPVVEAAVVQNVAQNVKAAVVQNIAPAVNVDVNVNAKKNVVPAVVKNTAPAVNVDVNAEK